jgi:hypothetical protein
MSPVCGPLSRGLLLGSPCAAALLFTAAVGLGQEVQGDTSRKPYNQSPLFAETKPIEITLTAPFGQLRRNRTGAAPYRAATLTYTGDSGQVSLPVRVRTRGIWRRKNCDIPPLMLTAAQDSAQAAVWKTTVFARLDKVRLTLHCRNSDQYEQYVLQEFQLYRVQRLLSPLSFDVRLARVTYVDSEKQDTVAQRYAFLQEEDEEFAARVGARLVTIKGAGAGDLDPYESAFLGVFQYFVGQSDFSVRGLHNVVLIYRDPHHVPVARDFDWTGVVSARYAVPNPILDIRTVRQRVMRGYCAPAAEYERVFALFREKKDAIYALYADSLAAALKPDVVRTTLQYFDEFYSVINNPAEAKRKIVGACLGGPAYSVEVTSPISTS